MAEYINRDALFKYYRALANIEWNKTVAPVSWSDAYEEIADHVAELPPADVVPKSEVDTWYQLYHSIKEELKLEKMYHRETENLCDRYCIESQQAKKQVAREIFEEINKIITPENHPIAFDRLKVEFSELKKKYTEDKDEQAPTRDPI